MKKTKLFKKILLFIIVKWGEIGGAIFIPQFLGALWAFSPYNIINIADFSHMSVPVLLWFSGIFNTLFLFIFPLILMLFICNFLVYNWEKVVAHVDHAPKR